MRSIVEAISPHSPPSLGLLLHLVIETPATIGFLFFPSATLPAPQPQVQAIIRQYGLLLGCTNVVIAVLLSMKSSIPNVAYISLEHHIGRALAIYHIGPLCRAASRIHQSENIQNVFASPWLHLIAHALCLGALVLP
jgi:hypothetical protein